MLIADEGFEMGEIDNSQSEARCTAYLSQDLKLIAALEDPEKDFYTTLGWLFFQIPYEQVTKEFRNKILKKIVHGTNYMMGAQTFIENAGAQNLLEASASLGTKISLSNKVQAGYISLKQFAQKLLDSYHVPFFRVREWYLEIKSEIIRTKMLKSPLGHVRYFFGVVEKNHRAFNSAVAHAPQNLSVGVINIGFWKCWQLVKKHKGEYRLKAQVHDSILAQWRAGRNDIRNEAIAAMNNPVIIHGRTLRIPTDLKVGNSWGTMKEL
jgi:DNA polymerase I-like protein with 3'-5' exonuclease and polymerase domains